MDSSRRHSFPIQGKSCYPWNDDLITAMLRPSVYPLTEENLAIHTQSYPPSKDARRRHARLFVENQRPVIEMEIMLEQQREQEIASYIPILNANSQIKYNEQQQQQQQEKKRNWLDRLTHWIRLDRRGKKRHRSWSAGTEKDDNFGGPPTTSIEVCQKRDSGISLFYNKRRPSSIQRSIVKQHPPPETEELIAFKYPKMVRKSNNSCIIQLGNNTTDHITPTGIVAI